MSLREHPRDAAAARVLRQFCEALIFEKVARPDAAAGAGGEADREGMTRWRLGERVFRAEVVRGAFDRPRIRSDRIEIDAGSGWSPATCEALAAAASDRAGTLAADLAQSAAFEAAAALDRPDLRHDLGYPQLEAWTDEGHPYHPCFKARSGFSAVDQARFGPEAQATFRLDWLLVERSLVAAALPRATFWEDELGREAVAALFAEAGVEPGRHMPLPLHPWQSRKLEADPLFQEWRASGRVVVAGAAGDAYRATQSVRTLMNAVDPRRAHVKTALALRNSSSLRILDPDFVVVGPAVSDWLAAVVDADPWLAGRMRVLKEYAAVIAGRDTPLSGHLAAIWRESPEGAGLAPDRLMPFSALSLVEPGGQPLIDPWVRAHGLIPWLDRLIETAVLPVWHLMVAQGIAIEAHGQNLLLVHENGWPVGLAARDFHDSLEYVPWLLARPDLRPDLGRIDPVYIDPPADRFHAMSRPEELRALVMDALFVFNLADLSALIARRYGLPERDFWRRLRAALDRHAARQGLVQRQDLFLPFARRITAESLLKRVLHPGRSGYCHEIANALAF